MTKIPEASSSESVRAASARPPWPPPCQDSGQQNTACGVLLVDADAQADATLAMGLDPGEHHHGRDLVDAVTYGDPINVVNAKERLDMVVAGREITRLAQAFVTEPRGADKLAAAFEPLTDRYDRIVIDLPPAGGASMIPTVALQVGEYLLVPTTDHPHDFEGHRVLGDDLESSHSDIVLLGVVLYKIAAASKRSRYEAYEQVRHILDGAAEPFRTIIRAAPSADVLRDVERITGDRN